MSVEASRLIAIIDGDATGAIRAYELAEARGRKSSATMGGIGKAAMSAMAVGAGALALGLGASVKVGMDFDKQMSAVSAKTGATTVEFDQLRASAIALGASTTFSATEVAQGMEIVGAAGLNTNQILSAMPGILDVAAASGSDIATVTDIMTASMAGFHMTAAETGRIGDVLARGANLSSASIEDLGMSLKYVAPIAKIMGMSIEDTTAALALMANAGIKGDQAGTSLRMGLSRLASEPKKAGAAMKKYGIEIADAAGKIKPFPQLLGEMQTAFAGMTQQEKISAATAIFGTEAATGMLAIIDASPEKYADMKAAMDGADGSAEKVAATLKDNLAGDAEAAGGAMESLAIQINDAFGPNLRNAVKGFTGMVNSIDVAKIMADFAPQFATLKDTLDKMWDKFKPSWDAMQPSLKDFANNVLPAINSTMQNLTPLLPALGEILKAVVDVGTGVLKMAQGDWASAFNLMTAGPANVALSIGLISLALSGLGITGFVSGIISGFTGATVAAEGTTAAIGVAGGGGLAGALGIIGATVITGVAVGFGFDALLQKIPGYQQGWNNLYDSITRVMNVGQGKTSMSAFEWLMLPPDARKSWLEMGGTVELMGQKFNTAGGAASGYYQLLSQSTVGAQAKVDALYAKLAAAPAEKKTEIKAEIATAEANLAALKALLLGLPPGTADINADTGPAITNVNTFQSLVNALKGNTVKIGADTSGGLGKLASFQSAVYGLSGRTVTITTNYKTTGSPPQKVALGGRFPATPGGVNLLAAEAGHAEYAIPMDGSARALALWQAAGRELGALGNAGASGASVTPSAGGMNFSGAIFNVNVPDGKLGTFMSALGAQVSSSRRRLALGG